MAEQENYDESLIKCEKINKFLPEVYDKIKAMQKLNNNFSFDLNLRLAEEYLKLLDTMHPPANIEQEKKEYVDTYRDNLVTGLRSLSDFFDNHEIFQSLTDEQKIKFSELSAKIIFIQDSIINIVTH